LTLGVKGGIFALANCAPNECAEVQAAFKAGDLDAARETYLRIFPVNTAVTATYGVAGLKYAADQKGYNGGHVRCPLLPPKDDEKEAIKKILKTANLL
jgi:4-hydroxy-2-oxoglutarate aldolase